MNIKTAIFLGAGASKAEGAPLQGDLFFDYFSSKEFKESNDEMNRELATFFDLMFGIDVDSATKDTKFPTFEEVLGMIDLAILRKESFKEFDLENRAANSGRLRLMSQYLVFLVAKVLDSKLQGKATIHRKLVDNLEKLKVLNSTGFVSTNYDILIDNALTEKYEKLDLNYGVDFRNFHWQYDWKRPRMDRSVFLFKPHGSLNWLFCPTCNELQITPKEKGIVTRLISDFQKAACKDCGTIFSPIIVPPTFYKDMNNIFLSEVWNRAENMLRRVEHIVFCGYSFPDADIHIKYLLKRAQVNRNSNLKFTVINNFPTKEINIKKDEKYRYERFLGPRVDYTDYSFEDFVNDPSLVL